MKKETRTVVWDEQLQIEAYRLAGVTQPFPNHFHEYYVVGFVEAGRRLLCCRWQEYVLEPGSLVLFNPGDNHSCTQLDEQFLDYRSFNISQEAMRKWVCELTGSPALPAFAENVLYDKEISLYLRRLHRQVMAGCSGFGKEEALLFLLGALIKSCGQSFAEYLPECRREIELACRFMEQNFAERLSLVQICNAAGLSKSALLRAFTKTKGITPYRYLETVRINEAKKLLQQGASPLHAAMSCGFADQSHFTNYFSSFIGLTPGAYREIFLAKKQPADDCLCCAEHALTK